MTQFVLSSAHTNVHLGQVLGRGGEGSVFAIEGMHDRVAKIYASPPDNRKVQKLTALTKAVHPSLLKIAAWPIDLICDRKGAVQGFVMPRIVGRRNIHELYSPKSRADVFPDADFRFLTHVAANIARAFAGVHQHGHVVGDVNHGNLLVGADGTVMLIDCDSFQIGTGTNAFTCDVGIALFTAPELHGRTFRGLVRTASHDSFGLAVLLFHLLYMGRHPFAGRYTGHGEMPLEKAISEYRFAYGPDRAANSMERPPHTVSLETMGSSIAQLFIRAFGRTGVNSTRPDAKTWVEALEKLKSSLRICARASWHHYPRELAACPWCAVEVQTGARLFGQRIAPVGRTGTVDLATLWKAILAVPDPDPEPAIPSEQPWHPPQAVETPNSYRKTLLKVLSIGLMFAGLSACNAFAADGGLIASLACYSLAFTVWPRVSPEKKATAEKDYSAAKIKWGNTLAQWKQEASQEAFTKKLKALENIHVELVELPNEHRRRLAKPEAGREIRQRQQYLDRFRIDRAKIRGIGEGRSAMLASYGIETADDIQRLSIMQIPGFGEALTAELMQWRQGHERNFRFNPNEPVHQRDIDTVNREFEVRRQHLLLLLQQGPDVLGQLGQEIIATRSRLMPMLEEAWTAFKIAEAHHEAL